MHARLAHGRVIELRARAVVHRLSTDLERRVARFTGVDALHVVHWWQLMVLMMPRNW